METLTVIGVVFGIFGLIAFVRLAQLKGQLKKSGVLRDHVEPIAAKKPTCDQISRIISRIDNLVTITKDAEDLKDLCWWRAREVKRYKDQGCDSPLSGIPDECRGSGDDPTQ